ncbi:MAG: arginase family protein [Candidatus Heimdallarchaeota archaeon]
MDEPFLGTFAVSEIESAVNVDAILFGVPFEDNIPFYPTGCSSAPQQIRTVSNLFSGQGLRQENIHTRNFLDFGDIDTKDKTYEQIVESVKNRVKQILDKKAIPLILGGDHSIALGTAQGFLEKHPDKKKIVWIDAHLDLMDKYPPGQKKTRATVLRRILELEHIRPEDIYFIGSRGYNLGIEEVEFLKKHTMHLLQSQDFENKKTVNDFLKKMLAEKVPLYVSLDLDVLDPSYAPGVSVPEPAGLTPRELSFILQKLANSISCFEIVELNPLRDYNDFTAMVVCRTIFSLAENLEKKENKV